MDKTTIYIVDSDILSNTMSRHVYSILGICGRESDIQQLTDSINSAFENLDIGDPEGIKKWLSENGNVGSFMECLTLKKNLPGLRLSCLVSNQMFSMMISYINAITDSLDMSNPEISNTIESIYPDFEKKCIPLLLNKIDMEATEALFVGFKNCLFGGQGPKGKKLIERSYIPIQMQYNNIKDLCDKLFSDMSLTSYIQYVSILKTMNITGQLTDIFTSSHCNVSLRKSIAIKSIVEQSELVIDDMNIIQPLNNERISLLFEKLVALNDYVWGRLCTESSSATLTDNEKYFLVSLWILFMGDYSSWMLSGLEYKRLLAIFEELRLQPERLF